MAKAKALKTKKSTADTVINIVIAVVIIAVLALAVVAVADKFKPDIFTVEEAAIEQGMTVEDFTAEFGLEGAKAEDNMDDYIGAMTCGNYAKLLGMTFEEFAQQSQLPETVTADTTVAEVQAILEELNALIEQSAEMSTEEQTEAAGEEVPAE